MIARAIALTIPCLPHSLADEEACRLAPSSRQGARDFPTLAIPFFVIARAIALTIPCLPHSLADEEACRLAPSSRQGRAIFRRSRSPFL